MIPKQLEQITEADLLQLIDEGRSEDRTIEYKVQLPNTADSEKIPQLLKPACSFANTDGGDLVYGIHAEKGIPVKLVGIAIDDVDKKKLSIEHSFQNGIEPQIRGFNIKEVNLDNGKHVLIIRLPRSWVGPHRIKSNARFYARNSAGSYELDVPQIKHAFLLGDSIAQKIKDFRADRIAASLSESAPVHLREGVRVILHLLPISSFAGSRAITVSEYEQVWRELVPPGSGSIDWHLNFDGLVTSSGTEENGFRAYAQLFRSGIIEYVRVYEPRDGRHLIPSILYEAELMRYFQRSISVLNSLGFEAPIYTSLALAGARGYSLAINEGVYGESSTRAFDRDVMVIADEELQSTEVDAAQVLKPMFDIIWNAGGHPASRNFDENNRWVHDDP